MSNTASSFDRVKNILGTLERRIDDARSQRLTPHARPHTPHTRDAAGNPTDSRDPSVEPEAIWIGGGKPDAGDDGAVGSGGASLDARGDAAIGSADHASNGNGHASTQARPQPGSPQAAWPVRPRSQYGRAKPLRRDNADD